MRLFKAQMVERVMSMANVPYDVPIENKMVTRAIASAQSQVETQNFETRKNVLKYDEVLNRQREVIYGERRRVLEGEDLHEQIQHFMDDTIDAYVQARPPRVPGRVDASGVTQEPDGGPLPPRTYPELARGSADGATRPRKRPAMRVYVPLTLPGLAEAYKTGNWGPDRSSPTP
ncbi:Protein translocase subunit SecA [Streptomyces fumanus]